MIIRVHYHDLTFKKIDDQIDIPETATVKDLLEYLGVPILKTVVIDGQIVQPEAVLKENSEVFLFSQMAGG